MNNPIILVVATKIIKRLKNYCNINSTFIEEFISLLLGIFVYQGARLFLSLYCASVIGPEEWGLWYFISLFIMYAPLVHLGAINGMNREIPYKIGAGKEIEAMEIASSVLGWVIITSITVAFIIVCAGLFFFNNINSEIIVLTSILVFSSQLSIWQQMYLKSKLQFKILAELQLISGFFLLAGGFFFINLFGLNGFISIQIIEIVLIFKILTLKSSFPGPQHCFKLVLPSIKLGFPILIAGLVYSFLGTVDRWVISSMLGLEKLGFYSIGLMIMGAVTLVPMMVSQQFYPRMSMCWGQNKSIDELINWEKKQFLYASFLTFLVVIPTLFLVRPIIELVLPRYIYGISSSYPLIGCALALTLSGGAGNVLNIIGKQVYYLIILIFAVLLMLILDYCLVINGYDTLGVAWATLFVFATYNLTLRMFVYRLLQNHGVKNEA